MKIWGRHLNNKPECIDDIPKGDVRRCLREYMMAFGREWKLWIGRRKDEPQ
jgi:hypothetical protein